MKQLLLSIFILSLMACNEKNEDKVKTIDKSGSVESKIHIAHLNDSLDVMKTENIYWVKGTEIKRVTHLDTIPSLGMTKEQGEDSSGKDTTLNVKKNYQIFITVN